MGGLRFAGALPDLPASPGVYVILCGYMGATDCHLGEILYIGLSNDLRRRLAYALASAGTSAPHAVQAPLQEFQRQGGVAHVVYAPVAEDAGLRGLENALLAEYCARRGRFPRWNKAGPTRAAPDEEARRLAASILDQLNVTRQSRT